MGVLSLTWGSSFILIKQSLVAYTPMQVGALRLCVAGLVLCGFGIRNFKYIPKNLLPWVIIGGAMGNFIPMFLFPIAQEHVSSSMAGILDSLVPLFIIIMGYLLFGIQSSLKQVMGVGLGFLGAIILMNDGGTDAKGASNLIFSMLIVLATLFYALNGLILTRYLSGIPSFKLSSVVFTIWFGPALIILAFSGFFGNFEGTALQWQGLGYVATLGIVGTAIAMILYYKLLQITSAIFASTVTYLMPVVAVIWGLIDGERLTLVHAAGGLLILLGVYLIQEKKPVKVEIDT